MEWIIVLIGIGLTLLLLFVLLGRHKHQEQEQAQVLIGKQLLDFQQAIVQQVRSEMHTLNETTTDHLFQMERNVNKQLYSGVEQTNLAVHEVVKQMVKMDQSQDQLKMLGQDITSLHQIFNDKKTRGIYGEIELYGLLESAYGVNGDRFATQYKLSTGSIVDAIVFGSDVLGNVAIDSKFPLENYNRMFDVTLNASQKQVLQNSFVQDVKKHIKAIAHKYIVANETSEFALMFLPAEAIFAYIHGELQELVNFGYELHVYLVSPTTLMAYLTAMKALYLGQQKNERIEEIQSELVLLAKEFERFEKRYENAQRDIERTQQTMREVLISAHKISKRFAKIEQVDLDIQEHKEKTL